MDPKLENFLPISFQNVGKKISYLFCIFSVLLTSHTAILFAVTSLHAFKNGEMEKITDALTMLIIYTFAAFAGIYWIRRTHDLEHFFKSIEQKYEHHSLAGLTFVSSRRSFEFAKKLTGYWQFACIFGVIFWALAPLMAHQRTFPLKCWYPFNAKQKYVYEVVYIIQFLAQYEMGGVFGNGSAVFVSIVVIMLGQFDVLFCSLKNIQAHSELLSGASLQSMRESQRKISIENDEVDQYLICEEHKVDLDIYVAKNSNHCSSKELQLALQYSMKRCILHHQFILKSCLKLEELFNPYCLFKSMQITMQLCLLVFIGVVGERSIIQSLNLMGYLALTSTELFMFTYYGELLRQHSLRAGEALLRSPWHKNVHLIKREVLIFLANTKKPVEVTAGKFFVMDIARLRSVVTQAFSFLTLLQKIAAKKP